MIYYIELLITINFKVYFKKKKKQIFLIFLVSIFTYYIKEYY